MVNFIYTAVVLAVVLTSSIALAYVLKRNRLLNFQVLVAIAVSAVIISITFPYICGTIMNLSSYLPFMAVLLPVVFILAYLTMVFMFTVLISAVISERKAKDLYTKILKSNFAKALIQIKNNALKLLEKKGAEPVVAVAGSGISESAADLAGENQRIGQEIADILLEQAAVEEKTISEEILPEPAGEFNQILEQNVEDLAGVDIQGKNILEKSVDTEENIDKMCIDTIISDTINIVENSEYATTVDEVAEQSYSPDILEVSDLDRQSPETEGEFDIPSTFEEAFNSSNETEMHDMTGHDVVEVADEEDNILSGMEEYMEPAVEEIHSPTQEFDTDDIKFHIDEAFRLKQEGSYEEAAAKYMQVLDKQPDKDLVFWVVLDMCVIYKNLGQAELARDVLESYVAAYGDIMDPAVKAEIERNL